jgi:hypothetical protein
MKRVLQLEQITLQNSVKNFCNPSLFCNLHFLPHDLFNEVVNMVKRTMIGVTIAFCMFLVSCVQLNLGDDVIEQYKDLTGHVMTIKGDRILVTEKVNMEEKAHPGAAVYTITEDTQIVSIEGETLFKSDITVGALVEVWHTGIVAESFPTQATATKILVYTDEESVNYAKVINAAFETLDTNITWWVLSFEKQESLYEVTFSELSGGTQPIIVKVDASFRIVK